MISVSYVRETGAQMEFMIELRKLKCSCDFGDFLNQVLWNHYVYGLVNTNTLKQLLLEKDDIEKSCYGSYRYRNGCVGITRG